MPRGAQEPLPGLDVAPNHGDDDAAWLPAAIEAIGQLAAGQATITADDLRPLVDAPPDPNMWGLAWSAAHRLGLIRHTGGYRRSAAPSRRHGAIAVWRRGTAA